LPDDKNLEPALTQRSLHSSISCLILSEFVHPKLSVLLRHRCQLASEMVMPKAAMDEHRPPPSTIGYVWGARQVSVASAKSNVVTKSDCLIQSFACPSRRDSWPHPRCRDVRVCRVPLDSPLSWTKTS